jgi:DNA segregation ATPase FtsK/SpoIIIE-like protein
MEVEHVFEYSVRLRDDFVSDEHIYTNIDFVKNIKQKYPEITDEWQQMALVEDGIQSIYFTKEKIDQLKEELCRRIMEDPNPFYINCTDWDGGYEVDESQLLENIREIKDES